MTGPAEGGRLRILVSGAGAVGSLLGGLLAAAGNDVTLVRMGEPANDPFELRVREPGGTVRSVVTRRVPDLASVAGAPSPDLVVFSVKQNIVGDVVAQCQAVPALAGVPALTVQNGVGAEDLVAARRPGTGLIAASLTAPVALPGPDEVQRLGRGGIGLARVRGDVEPLVDRLVADFGRAGLRARRLPDAASMKWSKLLTNLLGNATGAILDMDAAEIYRDPRLFAIERRQLREALEVMRRLGLHPVALPGAAVPWLVRAIRLPDQLSRPILVRVVGGARGGKTPSLRLHVRGAATAPAANGLSEAGWLNGGVAAGARSLGLRAPVNARLAELVDELTVDPERREAFRGRPDLLRDALDRPGSAPLRRPILPGDADS